MQNFLKIGLFIALVVVIAQLFPHKSRTFKYHYEVGRTWNQEDLVADFSFPIYKTEEQFRREQDEAKQQFAPYYNIDAKSAARHSSDIIAAAQNRHLSGNLQSYLQMQFDHVYAIGIISIADMERMEKNGYSHLTVVDSRHLASAHLLKEVFTPRTAYDRILSLAPEGSTEALKDLNLNNYLLPNLSFDTLTTRNILDATLAGIAPTQGMIQSGETIIRNGETITDRTAQVLRSLEKALSEDGVSASTERLSILGNLILICALISLLVVYLWVFRQQMFRDLNTLLFLAMIMTIIIALACVVTKYTHLSIYIVPFAWVPIIVRVFFDARTALYTHIITVLICSMLASMPFEFLLLQVSVGMVAVSSLRDMTQRAQLAQTAGWILLAYSLGYTAFALSISGDWHTINWQLYIYFACNALIVICAYGIIYIIEKVFHLLSSITLVELNNINSGLMMEFAEKAPGTFQHSLQVSNLAMEAARRIGANPLLVRTGALYHDIGKMACPQNYTENQQDGVNPLSQMDYVSAAQEVIKHVNEGVAIAEKNNLPQVIVQFIQMHHGTSKTRYFYNSYKNAHPNEEFDESVFQYPGPRPQTKETAILMMADAVEARSRSLNQYTEESIAQMVDNMISSQMADGQLEDTPLTFKDIKDIKAVFIKKLISMNHHRIEYPELNK